MLTGQWISWSGRYKPNALVGPVVLGTGLVLPASMDTSTTIGAGDAVLGRSRASAWG